MGIEQHPIFDPSDWDSDPEEDRIRDEETTESVAELQARYDFVMGDRERWVGIVAEKDGSFVLNSYEFTDILLSNVSASKREAIAFAYRILYKDEEA